MSRVNNYIGAALAADASVAAAVPASRRAFNLIPRENRGQPSISYSRVGRVPFTEGIVVTEDWQVSVRGAIEDPDAVEEIADFVENALVNSAPASFAGVDVQKIEPGPRTGLPESATGTYHVPITLRVVVASTLS